MNIEDVSRIIHAMNQNLQREDGGHVAPDWDDLPGTDKEWMQESSRQSVLRILAGVSPREEHEAWYRERVSQGWTWGPVRDEMLRTNPMLIPYDDMGAVARIKDSMRTTLVRQLAKFITEEY